MIAASVWSLLLPGIDLQRQTAGWMACHDRWFFVGSHHIACGRRLMKAWYEREKSTQLTLGKVRQC